MDTFIAFYSVTLMIVLVKGEEYCNTEMFRPSCTDNQVVVVSQARYGRMQLGKCIYSDYGFIGCGKDVLQVTDKLCSGRNSCEMSVSNRQLVSNSNCPLDLSAYLNISYKCHAIYIPSRRQCHTSETVDIKNEPGYFASITAKDTSCGLQTSPLVITAKPGQQVALKLMDFAWNKESISPQSCTQKYGYIYDVDDDELVNICGGGERVKSLYISSSHKVQVILESSQLHHHFLVEYKAVGCPDIDLPNTWVKRKNNTITVGCVSSTDTWRMVCINNIWLGVSGTCPETTTEELDIHPVDESTEINDDDESKLPHVSNNHVVAFAVGCITVIICCSVVILGIFCNKRYEVEISKSKQQIQDNNYVTTVQSPMHKSTLIYKPVIAGYHQQATLPLCTLPRVHSDIPPGIPKRPPSCRMNRSTDDLIFMGDDKDCVKFYVAENPGVMGNSKIYQSIIRDHSASN